MLYLLTVLLSQYLQRVLSPPPPPPTLWTQCAGHVRRAAVPHVTLIKAPRVVAGMYAGTPRALALSHLRAFSWLHSCVPTRSLARHPGLSGARPSPSRFLAFSRSSSLCCGDSQTARCQSLGCRRQMGDGGRYVGEHT